MFVSFQNASFQCMKKRKERKHGIILSLTSLNLLVHVLVNKQILILIDYPLLI